MILNTVLFGNGIPPVPLKAINFYDYDGTRVYSYTLDEAQALTALPEGPSHEGLVFQGWNWTLEKVKALTGPMDVGAVYITDDGKSRLKIRVQDTSKSNVPLEITQTVASGVTIDWGDGSSLETPSAVGKVSTTHQYATPGNYTITLTVAEGCTLGFGNSLSPRCVLGSVSDGGEVYSHLLREVNIGSGVTILDYYAFNTCYSLEKVTIPRGVTEIRDGAFQFCYHLKGVIIPDGVTLIDDCAFYRGYSLTGISIPDSVTVIEDYAFFECNSLDSVAVPSSVTSVGRNSFVSRFGVPLPLPVKEGSLCQPLPE